MSETDLTVIGSCKDMNTHTDLRLLYVEDNEDTSLIITHLLGLYNIEVLSVKTVVDAVELAAREHFDLYLLDIRLPDGDGFDLCRRLRGLTPEAPVVFYSASDGETDRQKAVEAGAAAYLKKPFVDDLMSTIKHFINENQRLRIGRKRAKRGF